MAIASSSADSPASPASPDSPAVLLLAYGAPERLEDVEPFLRDVRGGRPTSAALVTELCERYAAIGGRSPLRARTEEQAAALARALGRDARVYVGMRHWHPFVDDVVARMRAAGERRAVVVPLAPHYSRLSIGRYEERVEAARGTMEIAFVRTWHDHPCFLDAVASRVREALRRFELEADETVPVLFTAHSLPARILADGDPYRSELEASMHGVLARLAPRPGRLAFQSAGRTEEPWLGPDAVQVLAELAAEGAREVLLCPLGIVSDHLEVLYDVDVAYQQVARGLGLRLARTESLNASPLLIAALAHVARAAARTRGWTAAWT
jgi:ferrochelatase